MGCDPGAMRQIIVGKSRWIALMLWVWTGDQFALAEPHMAPEMVETLKNSQLTSGQCQQKIPDKKPELSQLVPVNDIKPDLPCAMIPMALNHQRQSANTVLVDTRTSHEFAQFYIDGAMNIHPAELRSKAFLKGKKIVLIGNGKSEQELFMDCKRLKSSGYEQVKVLWGGMPAWLTSGLDALGQSPKLTELTKLSASELWVESQFASNLILVTASQAVVQQQIPGSLLIADEKPQTILSAVKRRGKKSNIGPLASVVLVTSKEADINAIRQVIKPIPLLVYSESGDAFIHQQTQQAAMWSAHARGPKQPSGCRR